MRGLLIYTFILTFIANALFAQEKINHPAPGLTVDIDSVHSEKLADSSSLVRIPGDGGATLNTTVYDIYWVTNSLKSGWKTTDTSQVGMGLELCDTAHPFTRPVVGEFWRGCTYYHSGWDIGMDYGSPVVAGLSGKVRYTKYCSGYGNLVIVRHYSGLEVYYAHLSKILVATDQWVEAGDTIGLVGATGRARGNHLHMEFRLCDRALDIADLYVHNDTIVNLYRIKEISSKQSQPPSADYHTVVRGDTLYDIARRYGTTVSNLCKLNNISSKSTLRIGQKIRVV